MSHVAPNVPGELIVEIEPGVWLDGTAGAPGRTLVKSEARGYDSKKGARIALSRARLHRPFPEATITDADGGGQGGGA